MEEFRPVLADRLALSQINRRQVRPEGFQVQEGGGVTLDDATRKTVLIAWKQRKGDTLTHPFLGEPTTVGLLPHLQARLLARRLRGDLDAYPPYFWKGWMSAADGRPPARCPSPHVVCTRRFAVRHPPSTLCRR